MKLIQWMEVEEEKDDEGCDFYWEGRRRRRGGDRSHRETITAESNLLCTGKPTLDEKEERDRSEQDRWHRLSVWLYIQCSWKRDNER